MENPCRLVPLIKDLLNTEKIPYLKWVDKEQQIWQLPWKHHRPTRWGEPDAYMLFEIGKKMYDFKGDEPKPTDLKTWKERLRNSLRSLGIEELKDRRQQDGDNPIKVYQFSRETNNGRRTRSRNSRRSPQPRVETPVTFSPLSDQCQNKENNLSDLITSAGVLDKFSSMCPAPSFRSRSPVQNDFQDIDTDGFSGNLDSILGGPNVDCFTGGHSHPINVMPVIPSGLNLNPHQPGFGFNDINLENGGQPNVIFHFNNVAGSNMSLQEFREPHSHNISEHGGGGSPVGNIPNCILDVGSDDSWGSEATEMDKENFNCEPHFNIPTDSINPRFSLSVNVNYLTHTVVTKRISDEAIRLCFTPGPRTRESFSNCSTFEQPGTNGAKVVELPPADECPGIDKQHVTLIQSILDHMKVGVTIIYRGDDIFVRRLCKAVPFYGIPKELQSKKLERHTEVKVFDFKDYFLQQFLNNKNPNPYVRLTFSVKNPDKMKTPLLSIDIWHMKANDMLLQRQETARQLLTYEPDCSLSNEFDSRLRIDQSLQSEIA